jgi:hypothetical protein
MWLTKDERKLLAYYFCELDGRTEKKTFPYYELVKVLLCKDINKLSKREVSYGMDRVMIANDDLRERGYIHMDSEGTEVSIGLRLQGRDLGRKYSLWWTRTGLLFEEYKHHWIWLIVGFLGGILGALIVNWLSKGD